VVHECDGRTDGQTDRQAERPLAIAPSNIVRRELKTAEALGVQPKTAKMDSFISVAHLHALKLTFFSKINKCWSI